MPSSDFTSDSGIGPHLNMNTTSTLEQTPLRVCVSHPASMPLEVPVPAPTKSTPPTAGQPRQKRAYHKKVRTGCITCKIRRLRCDEAKPSCNRCVSTGRKCDGYATPPDAPAKTKSRTKSKSKSKSVSASPPSTTTLTGSATSKSPSPSASQDALVKAHQPKPAADVRLMLPRMNPNEVRSYRYFLEVVGPALSGFFDADFWLAEIPRVCHTDAAIWHAIVSLGAVHECNGGPMSTNNTTTATFALQQFNTAIRCLTESKDPRHADKGRALTISTIFACMATMQGQHDQANMHLAAGVNLLREFDGDDMKPVIKSSSEIQKSSSTFESIPVSIAPIRNLLLRMDMMRKALLHGGLHGSSPPSQILENNIFRVWRSYTVPRSMNPAHCLLTPETLLAANRAAESLMNGLVYASQEQSDALGSLFAGGEGNRESELARLIAIQRPHVRGYKELRKAVNVFEEELEKPNCGSPKATKAQLRNAMIPLKLYLSVCRMVLIVDPDEPDIAGRARGFPQLCQSIIDDASHILSIDETYLEVEGKKIPFTLNPTTLDALFMVSHTGPMVGLRRQAADLLRRPRLEGLWHTVMAANLADMVIEKEILSLREYRLQKAQGEGNLLDAYPTALVGDMSSLDGDIQPEEDGIHAVFRVRTIRMNFTGPREAMVWLQTWGEWMKGHPGGWSTLRW